MNDILHIHSIFESLSGEVAGFPQGSRAAFVRLSGCNLNCPYCDAPEAKIVVNDTAKTIAEVLFEINEMNVSNVMITGGEPLLQSPAVVMLCKLLGQEDKLVTIETNGTIPVPFQILNMSWVTIVMDWKFLLNMEPDPKIFEDLRPIDFVKFVIAGSNAIEMAISIQKELQAWVKSASPSFAYSPLMMPAQPALSICTEPIITDLIEAFRHHKIDAILNLQVHKLLNIA